MWLLGTHSEHVPGTSKEGGALRKVGNEACMHACTIGSGPRACPQACAAEKVAGEKEPLALSGVEYRTQTQHEHLWGVKADAFAKIHI